MKFVEKNTTVYCTYHKCMFDLKLQQTIPAHNFSIMFCSTSTAYEVMKNYLLSLSIYYFVFILDLHGILLPIAHPSSHEGIII